MDRPRSKLGPVVRGFFAIVSALIAVLLIFVAFRYISGFVSPDSGTAPGSIGHLFVASFWVLISGPFFAIAWVLGMPLISKNPKYRGADR